MNPTLVDLRDKFRIIMEEFSLSDRIKVYKDTEDLKIQLNKILIKIKRG